MELVHKVKNWSPLFEMQQRLTPVSNVITLNQENKFRIQCNEIFLRVVLGV